VTLSFRNSEESSLSLVILLSAVIIVGCVVYRLTQPKLDPAKGDAGRKLMTSQLYAAVQAAEQSVKHETKLVSSRLWDMPAEEVGPVAMAKVNDLALANHLKIDSFRPARIVDNNGLEQIPFQVTVDGVYPNVIAFTRALEHSPAHFAVNQVQMSAADGNTDNVASTIGIIAFRQMDTSSNGQS